MKITVSKLLNLMLSAMLLTLMFSGVVIHAAEWDPWMDVAPGEGDGIVDISDIVTVIDYYGTFGDTARNVTIVNWPPQLEPATIVFCENYVFTCSMPGTFHIGDVSVSGYKYISVFVGYTSTSERFILYCLPKCHTVYITDNERVIDLHESFFTNGFVNWTVGAPSIMLSIQSFGAGSIELTIALYCYN